MNELRSLNAPFDPMAANRRLRARAEAEGLIDVAVGSTDSPIGTLTVAVTRRGVATVLFEDDPLERTLERIATVISPRVMRSAALTDEVRRELDRYFARSLSRFGVRTDRRLIGGISREVLSATSDIPYGTTSTYGKVAAKIGRPTASRAVGRALGSNPIPIVIPCHRVVGSSGALTGYAGGVDRKRALLELEGVDVRL
jgi:methylated-DNA-[protein]-cysteine S-methyltransferase